MTKEFLQQCLAEGLSLSEIGRRVGREKSTVSYHVRKHGLTPVNATRSANRGGIAKEQLQELVAEELSIAEMARRLDRSVSTIRYWLKRWELWPLPATRRRREARRARLAGKRQAELECRHHGRTQFVFEARGSYRCMRCRQERVAEWRRRVKRTLVAEAGGACSVCGYDTCVAAMHFHHLDPSEKRFALSREGMTRSLEEARREARKCILVCSNCHAEIESGLRELPQARTGKIEGEVHLSNLVER